MREKIIKGCVLGAVFVLALAGFGFFLNRGSVDMTADMDVATLPVISFITQGKEANLLVGHKQEMSIASMRDTISVCDENETLTVKILYNESGYDTFKYEILTLDGEELLYEDVVKIIESKIKLNLKGVIEKDEESVLKITLKKGDSKLYYYTRIVKDNDYHLQECLEFIEELHSNMLKKENEDDVKRVMEPSSAGNNTTLQNVTIHSNLDHSMWGDLKPEVIGKLQFKIKETKKAYTSVLLKYQVKCAGDNNEEEIYKVNEFFKVSYGKERIFLLEYNRTLEEKFDTSNVVLGSKGIILGLTEGELQYKRNEDGTVVAFVQANELWNYNKDKDMFTLVFSFAESEKEDLRNEVDKHSIQLLSMENDGSMTFSVCGYMNRGLHEGESGTAIYYYDVSENTVKEEAFIPSNTSQLVMEKEGHELAFYSKEQNVLYAMVQGNLLKVELEKNKKEILIEGLQKEQYVASEDGHLLAYQSQQDKHTVTEIWNFKKDNHMEIPVSSNEQIHPLGFVGDDFVYGISVPEQEGIDVVGNAVRGMHRLEIRNQKNKVIKTYEKPGVYILDVAIGKNQIVLKQATKQGNVYREIAEDYITNNETSANELIKLDSYWTDLKQTQYRLVFTNGIKDKKARTTKAKQVLLEMATILKFEEEGETPYFYVYGLGKQAGIFEQAGEAISYADALSGVVISPGQNYVWEDGNRVSWYRNFEINRFTPNGGETTLAACVRKVLSYEGVKADVTSELATSSAEEVMEKYLKTEVVQFRGCSSKAMFYLIDKGVPVIALKDSSSAILLIGYDAKTVTYVEPSSGNIFTSAIEKVDEMLSGSGKTFVAYVR